MGPWAYNRDHYRSSTLGTCEGKKRNLGYVRECQATVPQILTKTHCRKCADYSKMWGYGSEVEDVNEGGIESPTYTLHEKSTHPIVFRSLHILYTYGTVIMWPESPPVEVLYVKRFQEAP